jgi:multidrug efflux pump subunit AcrA (membrane-fusion protein)
LDIRTEEVQPRQVAEKVLAYATLVSPWRKHAYVSTRLPGRIIKLHVKPGQIVDAGQEVAEVQSLELEDLQLEILNLQMATQLAAKVLEQIQGLSGQGAISEKDYRKTVYTHQQSVNALDVARAKWLSLGLGTDKLAQLLKKQDPKLLRALPIVAPLSGTVIHADISPGKIVEPTDHLLEIMEFSSVWVKIGVLERDLHKIKVGQSVESATLEPFGPNWIIPRDRRLVSFRECMGRLTWSLLPPKNS